MEKNELTNVSTGVQEKGMSESAVSWGLWRVTLGVFRFPCLWVPVSVSFWKKTQQDLMRMAEERSWPAHLGGDSHRDMSTMDRKWPTPSIHQGCVCLRGFL